jgi:hypothetical protein
MKSKSIVMSEIYDNLPLVTPKEQNKSNLSDLELARDTLRAIALRPHKKGATAGIGASLGLMRLVQMQADLPNHVIDGVIDVTVEDERKQLKEKSPADLAREYKELLEGA